jgi:hypothetical protein
MEYNLKKFNWRTILHYLKDIIQKNAFLLNNIPNGNDCVDFFS